MKNKTETLTWKELITEMDVTSVDVDGEHITEAVAKQLRIGRIEDGERVYTKEDLNLTISVSWPQHVLAFRYNGDADFSRAS